MWADIESEVDYLNFNELAVLVAELLKEEQLLPISIGVFGGWGTGKSSLLKLIQQRLLDGKEEKGQDQYLFVKFDAWLFQDFDDARAALLETIATSLTKVAKEDQTVLEKIVSLGKRVNAVRVLGKAAEFGGALAFGIPPGIVTGIMDAYDHVMEGTAGAEDIKVGKEALKKVKEGTKCFLKPAEDKSPPEEIMAFRREFSELLNKDIKRTVVVFIDNLDRCLPDHAIQTLEAMRLFLFMPKTAFIIAADEDMIRHSIKKHFKDLESPLLVTNYLDKLVQVPVRVPLLGVAEMRAYMTMLFALRSGADATAQTGLRTLLATALENAWRKDYPSREEILTVLGVKDFGQKLELAERLAPLLASSKEVAANPRIVKRLLNTISLRARIAAQRGMTIDEVLLAKIAVLERCTDTDTAQWFYREINEAADGKPKILKELEQLRDAPDQFRETCPPPIAKHVDFLFRWAALPPDLADLDLRPAVYLSRDSVALAYRTAGLSAKAANALEVLLKVARIHSGAGEKAIDALQPDEYIPVMDQVITELRKAPDWKKTPPGFYGALLLAKRSLTVAAPRLGQYIASLPEGTGGAWMPALLKDETWVSKLPVAQRRIPVQGNKPPEPRRGGA
ncbi:P-loop NTPase fold protein [uncultured Paludibaculum sp.]|uniref:KAP family P-loop NTPase fold protein n=1 Tax=uncultured Paludibaculum sp. TaxID=1765020 RepID=UPI002AAAFA20|nr:P-loop NTPase fold protein [uncultured Paludibaculum sp.]